MKYNNIIISIPPYNYRKSNISTEKTTQESRFLKNQYPCIVLFYYPIATNDPPMLVS